MTTPAQQGDWKRVKARCEQRMLDFDYSSIEYWKNDPLYFAAENRRKKRRREYNAKACHIRYPKTGETA